jgi:hypothetical protein
LQVAAAHLAAHRAADPPQAKPSTSGFVTMGNQAVELAAQAQQARHKRTVEQPRIFLFFQVGRVVA